MAGYNTYDPRLESLVVETRTAWEPEFSGVSPEEKRSVAKELQSHPALATKIAYERTHTGFIRHLTVTAADLARLGRNAVTGALT
ncbi:hypothetical protein [Planctomicrobium piriforme]|uniref:Uncharacterized protein n=1 Tax=Planctomicrobium piriforme TaxID=1576369 RepID=A0A1I3PE15_9PLAN|nr:hypothetical protein [Planctomicrobium piriforme]SFJ19713.1 hypothetical protein SAMN05421753_116123 [Planctomicrobium piriforme]